MSDTVTGFAAHLAALARVTDPEDRAATRLLGAVAQDWALLGASATPSFELDGPTLWVGATAVALPTPWRDALFAFEGALRAHGVGGARLVGPVDRGTVLALVRGARALPPHAPREELQRWVLGHGGAALSLLAPRPATARDARAAMRPLFAAWETFAAAVELPVLPGSDARGQARLEGALRTLIDRSRQEPRGLPVVLAFAGSRANRRPAAVATLALLLGLRLGLPRGALYDLALAALEATALPHGFDATEAARATARRISRGLGQTDARIACTLWGMSAGSDRGTRPSHLFARIVALADEADAMLRADGPGRLLPDEAMARLQSHGGRRHDAALVEALVSSLGRYPVGSAIVLDSGEVGIVCRAPASGVEVARPLVRVVVDRTGAILGGGPLLDLAQPARARARIIATLDPARIGIPVAEAVLG